MFADAFTCSNTLKLWNTGAGGVVWAGPKISLNAFQLF